MVARTTPAGTPYQHQQKFTILVPFLKKWGKSCAVSGNVYLTLSEQGLRTEWRYKPEGVIFGGDVSGAFRKSVSRLR